MATTALDEDKGQGEVIPIRNLENCVSIAGRSPLRIAKSSELSSPHASSVPDRITLLHCVEMLRSGITQGVEAIKGILKRWATDFRWLVVLELEEIAPDELRNLEQSVPDFYALLSEAVLPMQNITD